MTRTKIEWTDETWNPVTGCSPISPGCDNCYARRMANRLRGRYGYPVDEPFRPGTFHPQQVDINMFVPGKKVFVCSMGDLFHEAVNIRGEDMRDIFRVMATHNDNIFQLLTKRPDRMAEAIRYLYGDDFAEVMPHVWVGVTVESQCEDRRILTLKEIPAAIRFISMEPLIGDFHFLPPWLRWLDWVIVGGETGPGARPMHPDWVRSVRDQCQAAGAPFFFKGWGDWKPIGQMEDGEGDTYIEMVEPSEKHSFTETRSTVKTHTFGLDDDIWINGQPHTMFHLGKKAAGRMLDGRTWEEFPR
jgi:protein gp37